MIKLIKLLINFNIYLQFKEHCIPANTITIIQGKSLNLVCLITPGHPKTPQDTQDTTGHSGTAFICIFNMLYGRVDDVLVLICSINVMWLYLFACIFSILERSLLMFD